MLNKITILFLLFGLTTYSQILISEKNKFLFDKSFFNAMNKKLEDYEGL